MQQKWLSTEMLAATAYLSVPATAPLRADPRFRDVVERVGLLQYWRSTRHPPDFCTTEKAPVCSLLKS
jgi:steroid 5-alpha reductase family enzyme